MHHMHQAAGASPDQQSTAVVWVPVTRTCTEARKLRTSTYERVPKATITCPRGDETRGRLAAAGHSLSMCTAGAAE